MKKFFVDADIIIALSDVLSIVQCDVLVQKSGQMWLFTCEARINRMQFYCHFIVVRFTIGRHHDTTTGRQGMLQSAPVCAKTKYLYNKKKTCRRCCSLIGSYNQIENAVKSEAFILCSILWEPSKCLP